MKYKRILLKLSGESLQGGQKYGLSPETLQSYAEQIKAAAATGVQIGIVIGGGNIFRGLTGAKKGFDRVKGDQMGMLATIINSLALQSALEDNGDLPRDYLLGTPSWDSLGYDPTPDLAEFPSQSRWRSLITLQSHECLGWCWQDGARLMAFIEDDKLRAQDFSRLQVDCG